MVEAWVEEGRVEKVEMGVFGGGSLGVGGKCGRSGGGNSGEGWQVE